MILKAWLMTLKVVFEIYNMSFKGFRRIECLSNFTTHTNVKRSDPKLILNFINHVSYYFTLNILARINYTFKKFKLLCCVVINKISI